tara:strand:- start:3668 stop:5065 length:1398 start_codon:yes stop_codon:yes gene_type:complete
MKRIDNATAVASKPAYVAGPNPNRYFSEGTPGVDDGTVPGQDFFNMLQEELCTAIEDDGYGTTLDGADDGQLAARLEPTKGIKTHATSLTTTSTAHKRAIVATTDGAVSGNNSAAVACDGTNITGAQAGAMASTSPIVSGDNAGAVGTLGTSVTGDHAGALGERGSTVSGDVAASVASRDGTVSGTQSASVASYESDVSGDQAATLACGASGEPTVVEKKKSAAIGCSDSWVSEPASGNGHSVLLSSINTELPTNFCIAAGYAASTPTPNDTEQNLTFKVDVSSSGNTTCDGSFTGGGADFAEYFEHADEGELGPGLILAGVGAKVRLAEVGDRVRGVVSATPVVIGNGAELKWSGRYKVDEWGRKNRVMHDNGLEDFEQAEDYDPSRSYTPRSERPEEWSPVALTGQVLVRVDHTVEAGDMVGPGKAGVGTKNSRAKGRPIECMEIRSDFDRERGYAIAWCLVG